MEGITSSPDLTHATPDPTAETSEPRSLNQLATQAARQVPACAAAAALVWRGGEPAALAASHPSLPELIEAQVRSGRGPVLDALSGGEPIGCPDTLDEPRWPEYADVALRQGVRCSLTLAHWSGADAVCLSLFGARPRVLGPSSVAAARRLVAYGGAVVSMAAEYGDAQRAAWQLRDGAESRAVVDQAKGILMHALGCSAEEALARMRQISQARNMKVTDVAATVIDSRGADQLGVS